MKHFLIALLLISATVMAVSAAYTSYTLGVGQTTSLISGGKTYLVHVADAKLNEVDSHSEATVVVAQGSSIASALLNTNTNPSTTLLGLPVTLVKVQKSYTPGQGGSAQLKVKVSSSSSGNNRFGFKDDGSPAGLGDYALPAVAYLIVLAFTVMGAMKDAESNRRLFQWE
jgi:hypothetical protein